MKTLQYTHLPVGQPVQALAGFYTPEREVRLEHEGRTVLYVAGQATIESSCCGCGSFSYAIVPGFVTRWQFTRNAAGLAVTELEPVNDTATQQRIAGIIKQAEIVRQVDFW